MFDWTIGLGNLLTLGMILSACVAFAYTNRGKIDSISQRLLFLEGEIKRLVDVLVQQGRQDERLGAVDARVVNQGARLDELTERFNNALDTFVINKHARHHPRKKEN